jgi:AbrB family looped-hinge helix DNA binding protein
MGKTITVDGAGRIVLPKPLRDRLRLIGGTKLRVEAVGDHLELTPEPAEPSPAVVRKGGLLVVPASGVPCDARRAIEAERDDRENALLGRL